MGGGVGATAHCTPRTDRWGLGCVGEEGIIQCSSAQDPLKQCVLVGCTGQAVHTQAMSTATETDASLRFHVKDLERTKHMLRTTVGRLEDGT